jgi:hypothetical protein
MRSRWLAALCALVFSFAVCAPALAVDRVISYPQQTSTSTGLNQQARNNRLALGTFLMQAFNLTSAGQGIYSNLTTSAGTGLYVTVAPTVGSSQGALYQVVVDDALPVPNNCPLSIPCTQIPADSTYIAPPALQTGATNPIGPLTAPGGAGQAVYWLIEAQVVGTDNSSATRQFLVSTGPAPNYVPQSASVLTNRTDQINYQTKQGTASAANCTTTFPAVPSTDSGWVLIAKVCVANGVSQVTSGMITAAPSFSGFFQSVSTLSSLTVGTDATSGQINLGTDGLGYLQRTGTNSFSFVSPSNPQVTAAGGWLAGSSTYGPTSATVNGNANATSFVASSSTYGATSATVNGTATATNFNVTGTNVTGGSFEAGTLGANTNAVIRFGNATSGSAYTSLGSGASTAAGVTNSLIGFGNTGTSEIAFDGSGNAGFLGNLQALNAIIAGQATAPSVSNGDLAASRSTTTGAVKIGGSGTACTVDFNITTASSDTFNCAVKSTAAITATQFNGSGAGLTSGTVPNAALVTTPVTNVTGSGNISSSGGTTPNITTIASPAFTSIGLDGASAGANGIACGVANTTNCIFKAQTGTSTTTGFSYDSTTACAAGTDTYFNVKVNGTSEFSSDCSGNTTTNGKATVANLQDNGLASSTNKVLCGQNNASITQCAQQSTLFATTGNVTAATGTSANTYVQLGTDQTITTGTSVGANGNWLVEVEMPIALGAAGSSENVYGCITSASTFTLQDATKKDGSNNCVTAKTNSFAGGPPFGNNALANPGLTQLIKATMTVANSTTFTASCFVAGSTTTSLTVIGYCHVRAVPY